MTTKEEIRNGVAKIAEKNQDLKNDITTFVKDEFKKSIELKNQTSDTIKEITTETLNLAKSYSKRLTNHSFSKISDWLKNLSNKVNS